MPTSFLVLESQKVIILDISAHYDARGNIVTYHKLSKSKTIKCNKITGFLKLHMG